MAKVFVCSNVAVDYFLYIEKYISRAGYDCTLVSLLDEHTYRQRSRSRWVIRLWLRFMMYVVYPLKLIWIALGGPKNSAFIVTSNTFYAPLLVGICILIQKGKLIHLVYDLYPDALVVSGKLKSNSIGSRLLGLVTSATQRFA